MPDLEIDRDEITVFAWTVSDHGTEAQIEGAADMNAARLISDLLHNLFDNVVIAPTSAERAHCWALIGAKVL